MFLVYHWPTTDKLMTIWKSDLSDRIRWEFFRAVTLLLQLYS